MNRVVITGLGVVSPNGVGIPNFLNAIKEGRSGLKFNPEMKENNLSCHVCGFPQVPQEIIEKRFNPLELKGFDSNGVMYAVVAGLEAWEDAGLVVDAQAPTNYDAGTVFGAGSIGTDKMVSSLNHLINKEPKKIGSNGIIQTMISAPSAYVCGKLGLGNLVTTNSSACATGAESIIMAFERIRNGNAKIMLAGSTNEAHLLPWASFDAMKVCNYKMNDEPERASRPFSAQASGFIPSAGAGAMVLESLDSALQRGAKIYGEILGGYLNSGGHRNGGTMTLANKEGVQRCIKETLSNAGITANEIDAINAHATSTTKDPLEVENFAVALGRKGADFPLINSLKSMIGHCLGASGSIESVATVLQLYHNFMFPNLNIEDLHPEITTWAAESCFIKETKEIELNTIIKSSFGFGDVNACVVFRKYKI